MLHWCIEGNLTLRTWAESTTKRTVIWNEKSHHVKNEARNSYPIMKKRVLNKDYIIKDKSSVSFMFDSLFDHK